MKRKLVFFVLLVCSSSLMADVYSLYDDWNGSSNPNGVWQYQSVFSSVADPTTNVSTFNNNRALFASYYAPTDTFYWAARTEVSSTGIRPDNAVAALVCWTAPELASCNVTGSLQSPDGQDDLLIKVLFQDYSAGTITELWSGTTTAGGDPITWDENVTVSAGDEILVYVPADAAYGQGNTNVQHPWSINVVTEAVPEPASCVCLAISFAIGISMKKRRNF